MISNEYFELVFGILTIAKVIVGCLFSLLGICFSLLIDATTRRVSNPKSPVEFDRLYFIKDNWKRAVLAMMLTYIVMRIFAPKIDEELGSAGVLVVGLACGLCTDVIALALKKFIRNYVKKKLDTE